MPPRQSPAAAAGEPASPGALLTARERAEAFLTHLVGQGTYDHSALEGLTVSGASPGRVVCWVTARPQHANRYGTMHGGCIATLVDVIGSAAIATVADRGGVSLAINTQYLSPMPTGNIVEIEATVAKAGKQVATANVELRDASAEGALVAQGTHIKALVPHSDLRPLWAAEVEAKGLRRGSGEGGREGSGGPGGGGPGQRQLPRSKL